MTGFATINWTILYLIPRAKKHTVKLCVFGVTLSVGVMVNLAYREWLPVAVDMSNLEFFALQIQINFVWTHCIMMHDFKWAAFLDGPVFLIACYFEAVIIAEIDANGDIHYHKEVKIKQKMFRALTIYALIVFAQFMQQKDLYVAIIQKELLAQ